MIRRITIAGIILVFFWILSISNAQAQTSTYPLVQFSGIVVTADSLQGIPFVSITIKDTYRGTISDFSGFFTLVARPRDTIEFSAIGYKKGYYIIPDSLTSDRYSMVKVLSRDTIWLQETIIYPWPTKDQFKAAFLNIRVPASDLDRANRNLALEEMRDMMLRTPMDGSGNYKALMLQKQNDLYMAGGYYGISLLNPIAWSKFIEAWQRGDYKKKQ